MLRRNNLESWKIPFSGIRYSNRTPLWPQSDGPMERSVKVATDSSTATKREERIEGPNKVLVEIRMEGPVLHGPSGRPSNQRIAHNMDIPGLDASVLRLPTRSSLVMLVL